MAIKLQIRRGTAANWTSSDPTLLEGEIGYELDTGNWKVGDGTTSWQTLPYQFPYLKGSKALDKETLCVDQTNDRVGIGTETPLAVLHVEDAAPIIRMRDTNSGAGIYSEIGTSNNDGTVVISADANNASGTSNASKIQFVIDNAATPQVTVLSDRKVGIGTATPASNIHVVSSTTTADINLVNSGTTGGSGGLSISTSSNAASITNVENSTLTFGTNNADRVTISAVGDVGIGTTSPAEMLHIEGTSPIIRLKDSAAAAYSHINADNTTGSLTISADVGNNTGTASPSKISFDVDASTKVTISNDGFVGIGETSPQAPLHINRSGSVQIISDPLQTSTAYSTITTNQFGGVVIAADPSNSSTVNTSQVVLQVDGATRLECQATTDANVRVPVGQTLHVAGTLRPTLGQITPNTIGLLALENINVAGGALLGRTSTGSTTHVPMSNVKSWLGLGSAASNDTSDFVQTSVVGTYTSSVPGIGTFILAHIGTPGTGGYPTTNVLGFTIDGTAATNYSVYLSTANAANTDGKASYGVGRYDVTTHIGGTYRVTSVMGVNNLNAVAVWLLVRIA
jgi:hypothetical protein